MSVIPVRRLLFTQYDEAYGSFQQPVRLVDRYQVALSMLYRLAG